VFEIRHKRKLNNWVTTSVKIAILRRFYILPRIKTGAKKPADPTSSACSETNTLINAERVITSADFELAMLWVNSGDHRLQPATQAPGLQAVWSE
jgi:hypothetical protein